MEFKGSKQKLICITAPAGESEARNKYTYYAGIAKKKAIIRSFHFEEETAGNEKESMLHLVQNFNERRYSACQPARILLWLTWERRRSRWTLANGPMAQVLQRKQEKAW